MATDYSARASFPEGQPTRTSPSRSRLIGWLGSHVGFLAVELAFVVGLVALTVALLPRPRPLPGDVGLTLWWQHLVLPIPFLTIPLEALSNYTFPMWSAIIIAVITAVFLVLRRWLDVLVSLGTLGVADGTNSLIGQIVQRPRPAGSGIAVVQHITGVYSFPSGHVEHAVAYLGVIVYLSFQVRRPVAPWVAGLLWAIRIVLLAMIVLMLPSRVLEGEHWPSDGLAALFEGGFWLLLAIQVYGWAARRWPRLLGIGEPHPAPRMAPRAVVMPPPSAPGTGTC